MPLLTFAQFSSKHPAFGEGAMRSHRFNSRGNANGFASAFRKVGKRVYVVEEEFFRCIDAMNGVGDKQPNSPSSKSRKRR